MKTEETDFSKLSNKELENIVNPLINKGAIPLKAVQEHQKRNPQQYTYKTVTS